MNDVASRNAGTLWALVEAGGQDTGPERCSPVVMSWRIPLTEIRAFLTGLPNLSITTPLMPRCTCRDQK